VDDLASRVGYSGDVLNGFRKKFAVKGEREMVQAQFEGQTEVVDQLKPSRMTVALEVQPDYKLTQLLADLAPEVAWGERQMAARKLGYRRCQKAVPALTEALPQDPFWMVRCEIIQALEKIGDPRAIPTLRKIAKMDGFQVVRAYATKAIERLYEKV
jgi:HEAT repeat protein